MQKNPDLGTQPIPVEPAIFTEVVALVMLFFWGCFDKGVEITIKITIIKIMATINKDIGFGTDIIMT